MINSTTAATVVETPRDLLQYNGRTLGTSKWRTVGQEEVDLFARATGDHQWIHTDVERAGVGPFGGTIAHGYMTLSLIAPLFTEVLEVSRTSMSVNYGLNRTRFPAPVPVGSRVRLFAVVSSVEEVADGVQITTAVTIECDRAEKPVCMAEVVFRYYS